HPVNTRWSTPSGGVEEVADPLAGRGLGHGLSVRIRVGWARAAFEKHADDPGLFVFGDVRARSALASVLNGKVEGSRTVLVLHARIRAVLDECPHRAR